MTDHLTKERTETDAITREALSLGIPISRDPEWWWIEDDVARSVSSEMWELIRENHTYLTASGKAGARRLIREERRKLQEEARQDIAWERQAKQWTLTKWGLVIGWLLGFAGILMSVFKG